MQRVACIKSKLDFSKNASNNNCIVFSQLTLDNVPIWQGSMNIVHLILLMLVGLCLGVGGVPQGRGRGRDYMQRTETGTGAQKGYPRPSTPPPQG